MPAPPPGFVLDQQQGAPAPPPGFVLDQASAEAPAAMSPETIAQDQVALEGAAMDRAAGLGIQDLRNLAGAVLPALTTAGGIAIGSPAGIPGMIAGGAAGASMGARGRQLLRGDPEPSQQEKALEAGIGAASGALGGALSRIFAARPDVKLSLDMRVRAKAVEKAFHEQAKAAGAKVATKSGKGFASPEAKALWSRAKVAEQIERVITTSRGNPDRLRDGMRRLSTNANLMGRLTDAQRALIGDAAEQSTAAGALRALGDLRSSLIGGIGMTALRDPVTGGAFAAGQAAAGMAGRALDRGLTGAAANRALGSVAGRAVPPAVPNVGAGVMGGAGAETVQQALIRQLLEGSR